MRSFFKHFDAAQNFQLYLRFKKKKRKEKDKPRNQHLGYLESTPSSERRDKNIGSASRVA
jgi:hypothetical protein